MKSEDGVIVWIFMAALALALMVYYVAKDQDCQSKGGVLVETPDGLYGCVQGAR